jgi:hypothetical protein
MRPSFASKRPHRQDAVVFLAEVALSSARGSSLALNHTEGLSGYSKHIALANLPANRGKVADSVQATRLAMA